jgi:hypothetical protein
VARSRPWRGDAPRLDHEIALLLRVSEPRQHARVADQLLGPGCVQPRHDLREGQGDGHGEDRDRALARKERRREAGGVHGARRRDHRDRPGAGSGRHQLADRSRADLGPGLGLADEDAPLAGAAAGRLGEIAAEQRHRLFRRRRERVLGERARETPVDEQRVELRHPFTLGERRDARQVGELEALQVQPAQPVCVEGRPLGGVRDQRAQTFRLQCRDLGRAPARAREGERHHLLARSAVALAEREELRVLAHGRSPSPIVPGRRVLWGHAVPRWVARTRGLRCDGIDVSDLEVDLSLDPVHVTVPEPGAAFLAGVTLALVLSRLT